MSARSNKIESLGLHVGPVLASRIFGPVVAAHVQGLVSSVTVGCRLRLIVAAAVTREMAFARLVSLHCRLFAVLIHQARRHRPRKPILSHRGQFVEVDSEEQAELSHRDPGLPDLQLGGWVPRPDLEPESPRLTEEELYNDGWGVAMYCGYYPSGCANDQSEKALEV